MKSIPTILAAVALSLALFFFLSPAKQTATKQDNALQRVLKTGTLRCGYTSFEPMLIIDPNTKKISGIAHDIMEEVGKKLAIKIEWSEESGWAEFVTGLNNNRFDAFCAGNWANSKRARQIAFSDPIAYSPVEVFVRAEDTRFDNNLSAINSPNIRIAAGDGGTPMIIASETFPKAKILGVSELAPTANLFLEVIQNKADVAIIDRSTGYNFMKNNPNKIKRVEGLPLRVFANVYSLNQGEVELQQAINQTLRELSDAGIIDRIVKQYEPLAGAYYPVAKAYQPNK